MKKFSAIANCLEWKNKSLFFLVIILTGCLSNEQDTPVPHTGPVTLQLHNFNSQGPNLEEGTAPQIHYFAQQMDGTYAFTMSLDQTVLESGETTFETDWSKEYIYVKLNDKGVIASTFSKKFSEGGGFEKINFGFPDRYQVVDDRLSYVRWATSNTNEQKIVRLNPESGVSKSLSNFPDRDFCDYCPPASVFTSVDGSIITVNPLQAGRLDYYFFSKEGSLSYEHKLPIKDDGFYSSEKQYFSHFLTKHGDDYYFLNSAIDTTQFHWYEVIYDSPTSSFYLLNNFPSLKPNYNVQVKFGTQYKQKVYRYTSPSVNTNPNEYIYADFKDLPFQAWDITNKRQLNIAFNDTDNNGMFSSGEALLIADSEYSSTPDDNRLTVNGGISGHYSHMIEAYWHDTPISILIFEQRSPSGLVKINGQEISTINSEIFTGLSVRTLHDIKSYQGGFAVLCNTSHYPNADDVLADVILLNDNFEVDQIIQLDEKFEQEKIMSNGSGILFSAVGKSTTLRLMTIKNGMQIKKDLTDLAQFSIESFQVTPTRNGGWAILAWVWQTPNTRDLLFMELDENLNPVKD